MLACSKNWYTQVVTAGSCNKQHPTQPVVTVVLCFEDFLEQPEVLKAEDSKKKNDRNIFIFDETQRIFSFYVYGM